MSYHNFDQEKEGGFHKGLIYGLLLGIGLVWFLGTKEGKQIKEDLLERGQNFLEKSNEAINETDEDDPFPPAV